MKTKHSKHSSTYPLDGGGFLHVDRSIIPIESTKSQHSKSPWTRMNSHKPGFHDIVSLGDDEPQSRKHICEVAPSDTGFHDAILIASAPELLEALIQIENKLATSTPINYKRDCFESLKISQAVIAKATGGDK